MKRDKQTATIGVNPRVTNWLKGKSFAIRREVIPRAAFCTSRDDLNGLDLVLAVVRSCGEFAVTATEVEMRQGGTIRDEFLQLARSALARPVWSVTHMPSGLAVRRSIQVPHGYYPETCGFLLPVALNLLPEMDRLYGNQLLGKSKAEIGFMSDEDRKCTERMILEARRAFDPAVR